MSTRDTQMNQYLNTIAEAVHGRDMRSAIHDGLEKTYNDAYTWYDESLGNANEALRKAAEALEIAEPMGDDIQEIRDLADELDTKYDETDARINNIIAHNNDTDGNSELIDVRTTFDGQVKSSAGSAVRSQISALNSRVDNLVREQSTGELEDCHAKPVYTPLYTNASPANTFAAQTLQLSLSGSPTPKLTKYALIMVTFKDSNLLGAGSRSVYIPNPGKDASDNVAYIVDGCAIMPADGTYGLSSYARKFTALLDSNDTVLSITFANCEKIVADNPFAISGSDMTISDPSSTATTDNNYLIPYEITLIDYVVDGEIEVDKDTELIDIRNGEDGTTYQSAGAAVRGQVVSAKNKTASTQSMIAPLYSVTGTYAAGDYVNYADKLYKAKQAISSEAWTPSHWQEVNVMDEVDSDVGELKSALNDIAYLTEETVVLDDDATDGASWTDGEYINTVSGVPNANADYSHTGYIDLPDGALNVRITAPHFYTLAFYTSENIFKQATSYAGAESPKVLPIDTTNAAKIIFSCRTDEKDSSIVEILGEDDVWHVTGLKEVEDESKLIRNIIPRLEQKENSGDVSLSVPDVKFGFSIGYYAKITTFDSVKIGRGSTSFNDFWIIVDSTNVSVHRYTTVDNVVFTHAHGLTISDYLQVNINVKYGYVADIIINTVSGSYVIENVTMYNGRGSVYGKPQGTSVFSDIVLSWSASSLNKKIWYYGDSYLDHYPEYLIAWGYANAMFDGYGGRGSSNAYASLLTELTSNMPSMVVWGLGMNDGDNADSINATWKATADALIEKCDELNIKLVFLTIPNTPTINNNYKNAYIRNSGKQYIDVAYSVNGDTSSNTWYSGLLASDNVHATNEGRQTIASYIITNLPELQNQ